MIKDQSVKDTAMVSIIPHWILAVDFEGLVFDKVILEKVVATWEGIEN